MNFKKFIRSKGLTQEKLADAMGCGRANISLWATGEVFPTPTSINNIVEGFAKYSEGGGRLVLYITLYGDGTLYARPYDMFASKVDREKYPNVKQEYRFELQNVESVATKFAGK